MADNLIYNSNDAPKSNIIQTTFIDRLNAMYGFRTARPGAEKTEFGKRYGLDFVKVDLGNPAYRVKSVALGSFFESANLSSSLEKYFDAYLRETSLSYNDIAERQQRLNELAFMAYNDPIISRCVKLVADEATQIDVQNRLISVESPNTAFIQKCYELFSVWGVTPSRIHGACYDLQLFGEAFWGHKVSARGVESIKPISVNTIKERLEFSPEKMAAYLAQRDGYMKANKDRFHKLQTLIANFQNNTAMDFAENLSDLFDTKVLGFELEDGNIAAPWLISHFRFEADHSEFFPYGRPPMLHCLAPFKQMYSTIALQGLARSMSFPITLYKVKTAEGMSAGKAFELVSSVKEEYDNIGLTPASAGSEVYTVNTKIWLAEGLLDIDVKSSEANIDFVGDLEIYQDRVMMAAGIPKGYLDQEYGGFGQSGIALTEQYKPFARHVYHIQTAFLEGLGQLIRLHFAITGEFDYNTPFVLTMRFPAGEYGEEQRDAKQASIELSQSVMELIAQALGIEEGEPLPEDVIVDILSKYTFLDATDIQKWVRLSSFLKPVDIEEDADENAMADDEMGFDDGGDVGGATDTADAGADMETEPGGDVESMPESTKLQTKKRLKEQHKRYLRKLKEERLKEISKRYKTTSGEILLNFLESNNLQEYTSGSKGTDYGKHCLLISKITESHPLWDSVNVLKGDIGYEQGYHKLNEKTVSEVMDEKRKDYTSFDPVERSVKEVLNRN